MLATLLVLLAAPLACSGPSESAAAARRFWEAVRALDFDTAGVLSETSDVQEVELVAGGRPIAAVRLGEALEDEVQARVPTELDIEGIEQPLLFETHLVRVDDAPPGEGWRVDLRATGRAARRAELAMLFDSASALLRDSAETIGDALEEGARDAARALEQSLREMERELEQSLRDQQRAPGGGSAPAVPAPGAPAAPGQSGR